MVVGRETSIFVVYPFMHSLVDSHTPINAQRSRVEGLLLSFVKEGFFLSWSPLANFWSLWGWVGQLRVGLLRLCVRAHLKIYLPYTYRKGGR